MAGRWLPSITNELRVRLGGTFVRGRAADAPTRPFARPPRSRRAVAGEDDGTQATASAAMATASVRQAHSRRSAARPRLSAAAAAGTSPRIAIRTTAVGATPSDRRGGDRRVSPRRETGRRRARLPAPSRGSPRPRPAPRPVALDVDEGVADREGRPGERGGGDERRRTPGQRPVAPSQPKTGRIGIPTANGSHDQAVPFRREVVARPMPITTRESAPSGGRSTADDEQSSAGEAGDAPRARAAALETRPAGIGLPGLRPASRGASTRSLTVPIPSWSEGHRQADPDARRPAAPPATSATRPLTSPSRIDGNGCAEARPSRAIRAIGPRTGAAEGRQT